MLDLMYGVYVDGVNVISAEDYGEACYWAKQWAGDCRKVVNNLFCRVVYEAYGSLMDGTLEEFEIDSSDDYASNMPCDNTGFCIGSACPNFIKCKG